MADTATATQFTNIECIAVHDRPTNVSLQRKPREYFIVYFHPSTKVKLQNGEEVTIESLLQAFLSTGESQTPNLYSPLSPNGDAGMILGKVECDVVRYSLKSGKTVTCCTTSRLILAGPGYSSLEDSAGRFPVLTVDGPDEIVLSEPVGKQNLIGISARLAHAVLVNGIWFLT